MGSQPKESSARGVNALWQSSLLFCGAMRQLVRKKAAAPGGCHKREVTSMCELPIAASLRFSSTQVKWLRKKRTVADQQWQ